MLLPDFGVEMKFSRSFSFFNLGSDFAVKSPEMGNSANF